jgi:hypothetical protein
MATGISALTTLDKVVKTLQYNTGMGDRNYGKLLGVVGRGLTELRMFHDPKVIEISEANLSDFTNGVMPYPDDCVKVIDVFYAENGQLVPLGRNNKLVYKNASEFPLPLTNEIDGVTEVNDKFSGKYAITGGRSKYYYKDDPTGRRLIFEHTSDEDIWVYYVGTGIDSSLGEETLIPQIYQNYLEYYTLGKLAALTNKKADAEFYDRKTAKEAAKIKYFRLPSFEEIKDAIYSTFSQAPKR